MRLHHLLVLAASFGLASAADDVDVLDKRAAKCGIKGNRILSAYFTTDQASFTVPAQCGALCKSKVLCQSYAVESGHCRLYLLPVNTLLAKILSGTNTYYDKACATSTDMCQVNGFRSLLNQPFSSSAKLTDNNFKGCSALCKATSGCNSFSIELVTGGKCRLYKNALVKDFTPDPKNLNLYWDINCPRGVVADPGGSLATSAETTSVPTVTTEAAVEFTPFTAPASVLTTNDPAYTPTGPQVTPDDDDEFISTYTYEEFELPTVIAAGSPPVTTGILQPTDIPTAPCLVQAGADAPFSVLNENFIPMVSRTSSIGPMLQPTAEPAANDPILDPETLVLPPFYLSQPAGVTTAYDLVYAGSSTPQYVAMTNTGAIVLVSASTGTAFKNNRVTTIFNVDCYGRLSVSQGGNSYTWSTSGTSSTLTKAASPANNMKALPVSIPAVDSARKHKRRNKELAERLLAKRSYSDGPAPKCPSSPPNLVAGTKAGYEHGDGNFCDNLSEYWSISPFDFDGSCTVQSLCYDACADFGWQSCNGIFGTMMILSCLDAFDSWWEVIPAIACAAQASYFTGVAATSKGRGLFYKAQAAMCRCYCSSPPDTCVYPSGDFYCADVHHGSDDANCGACGRQCGPNSKCRTGECGCPKDQCGTTCLDFRNNPKNCGSCGNVCDPAYCLDGRCYVPQPGDCVPEQSVYNNDFTSWYPSFVNWTMAAYDGCTLGSNIEFSATNYLANGNSDPAVLVAMTSLPNDGCSAAMVQAQVKMCPNTAYEFTFAMGYVNKVGDSAVVSNADCTVRWLTGTPASWNGNDGYQSSDSYPIGKSNPNYKTFGPWKLHATEGDLGVTKVKKSLYVNLTAVIHCGNANGGAGRFVIRDIQMMPVGSLKKARTIGEDLTASFFLGQRDGDNDTVATNVTEELAPYYPDQEKGAVLITSFTT